MKVIFLLKTLTKKEADGLGDGQNKVKCHVKKLLAEYEIVEDRTKFPNQKIFMVFAKSSPL